MKKLSLLITAAVLMLSAVSSRAENPDGFKVAMPAERSAYFVGEKALISVSAPDANADVNVELVSGGNKLAVYKGKPCTFILDTTQIAPGEYAVQINGTDSPDNHLFIVPIQRVSIGSFQDESFPGQGPQKVAVDPKKPELAAQRLKEIQAYKDTWVKKFKDTAITANMGMMTDRGDSNPMRDLAARTGMIYFLNLETRPTSFCPPNIAQYELDGMTQRMFFASQTNGRYPTYAGTCLSFDSGGFQPGVRRILLTYWNWGDNEARLRKYLQRLDENTTAEFKRRTGYDWPTPEEYIKYTLAIKRPDMASAIDLPTQRYLEDMAQYMKPMSDADRIAFEKRLDAWATFLMGIYNETYTHFISEVRKLEPSLHYTSSVQIDHAPVIYGQYLPSAYKPLDLRYQSTWNDQVGAPDYIYQSEFSAAMLNMERPDGTPLWISNSHGYAHGKAGFPGKLTRVGAQILAQGGSGIGFAFEGFATILGGMAETPGGNVVDTEVNSCREFMQRFASLALEGRGDYGAGVLFSKTQFGRQYVVQAFGTPQFRALISLTKLGYTAVYLTEDDVINKNFRGVKSIAVLSQTVPLPIPVLDGLKAFVAGGGTIIADGSTIVELPAETKRLPITLPIRNTPGKPHNWMAPNGDPTFLFAEQHQELAPVLEDALAGKGHALFRAAGGSLSDLTLTQIDGGTDAKFLIAINDSFVNSQADWHVLHEQISPINDQVQGFFYDLTQEKSLGKVRPITCDLEDTTARVYAILPRELPTANVRANQKFNAGDKLVVSVGFGDFKAVLPFYLTVREPDGKVLFEGYRSTDTKGEFAIALQIPANSPAGAWKVEVRSQLDGRVSIIPIQVTPAAKMAFATPYDQPVIARNRAVIDEVLSSGKTVILPLFPAQSKLAPIAEKIRAKLESKGVKVEVRSDVKPVTYVLGYDPTAEELATNEQIEKSAAVAKIKRNTNNGNDWFGGHMGYYCSQPLILLDLADVNDNEIVEVQETNRIVWPSVSDLSPSAGRAVVQGIPWAFAARTNSIIIQATDEAGLSAAADRIADLPEDFLTPSVQNARVELLRQQYIGGKPARPQTDGLTADGITYASQPNAFHILFTGYKPYPADKKPNNGSLFVRPILSLPALVFPEKLDTQMHSPRGGFIHSNSLGGSDMRFADAAMVEVDMPKASTIEIAVEGTFRYHDRSPCYGPQWEDLLAMRAIYIPKDRIPPSFNIYIDGKAAGKLDKVLSDEREVQMELYAGSKGAKPKFEKEEVAIEVNGKIDVPAGRHTITIEYRDIIDGILHRVRLDMSKADADTIETKKLADEAAVKKAKEDEQKAAVEAAKKAAEEAKKAAAEAVKKNKPQ